MATLNEKQAALFTDRNWGVIAPIREDGSPHATPVWIDYDGENVLVNSAHRRNAGMSGTLLLLYLRFARLPSLPPPVVDAAAAERELSSAADRLLGGDGGPIPEPRLDFLRWLAENRAVVFHGSPRDDLTELSTERQSRDATAWGNQEAVYASSDPVWAIYFACLRRDRGWSGTRNGSLGRPGGPLYPRRYFFLHNHGSASPHRFAPGSLYVLPPETFVADAPLAGVLDTAHLVSHVPVRPLARIDVTPEDFPFRERIRYFRKREPVWVSLFRA
jgi:hypothetical protein